MVMPAVLLEKPCYKSKAKLHTLGAETFANFANFVLIRESLRREKFYIYRFAKVYAREIFQFFLFSPNLLAVITLALHNALILTSWRKKGRRRGYLSMRV